MRASFIIISLLLLSAGFYGYYAYHIIPWYLFLALPLILLGLYDIIQTEHSVLRNYPVVGHVRWLMEKIRPMMQQYFVESDLDGAPINRVFRSVVYQRSKKQMDTIPYGTKFDVYRVGYEWIGHSMAAVEPAKINHDIRLWIGGKACKKPYHASVLNISAMSFGALSSHAIMALNKGAKKGHFAHNTGEGGISSYHLSAGGDLIWQLGTAYFGCRRSDGQFDPEQFAQQACLPVVKMIEIKLSQGAKPGHGGVLPACKNTPEIAAIRGVKAYTEIISPATHSAFSTPLELMAFIAQLRTLSEGKPIGIKLCIGQRHEFIALCKAMHESGILPDFITVDGAEGGTGAAPLEYANSIGMPLMDALNFVDDCLTGFELRKDIRIIASGKVFTAFHIIKRISLGADLCHSARGMMLALGCIQSLQCNTGKCPTGVTSQHPALVKGLVINDKAERVANFHYETVKAVAEILGAAGVENIESLNRQHVFRRVSTAHIKSYQQIYPPLPPGSLLEPPYPEDYAEDMAKAHSDRFS